MKTRRTLIYGVALTLLGALPALAESPSTDHLKISVDTVWTLIAAFLVFFMQAGFAMVETGFTRAKNAGNIMMKNLLDFSMGGFAYWAIGFGLMFGVSNGFTGWTNFFADFDNSTIDGQWGFTFWLFQVVWLTISRSSLLEVISGTSEVL